MAFVATVLSACGKTVENNNSTDPVSDTAIENTVEPEEENENDSSEEDDETQDDQEVKPADSDLPEPTFVQNGENNYTVTIDCPDNSDATELQTARQYDYVIEFADMGGVSEN